MVAKVVWQMALKNMNKFVVENQFLIYQTNHSDWLYGSGSWPKFVVGNLSIFSCVAGGFGFIDEGAADAQP